MFSICCNSRVKSSRNQKRSTKDNKNYTYYWEGIHFLLEKGDSKNFKKNNATIAPNVLYVKQAKIYPAYVSKYNSNREKQFILLMILSGKKWYYVNVKNYQHY